MAAKIYNYYAAANSARGYISYLEDNLQGVEKVYILKGGSNDFKSLLMTNLGINWYIKGFDIEYIHSAFDEKEIETVIIPALAIAVINGDSPHFLNSISPSIRCEIVIMEIQDTSRSEFVKKELISDVKGKIEEYIKEAYDKFQEALSIHDEWEKIYLDNIDFEKLNEIANNAVNKFFDKLSLSKEGILKNRFFGGATYNGTVNFVMDLTKDLGKRYFIKGRPGSGKSTFLKKIANAAQSRGFDVEVYHCGFDPESLDMVIVKELDFAVFDSTSPLEFFPSKEGDEVIDIYSLAITPGTDEKYQKELKDIATRYKAKVGEGIALLGKARKMQEELNIHLGIKTDISSMERFYRDFNERLK